MLSFWLFQNFIISVGANADSVMTIKFWTMGSLAGTSWADLVPANYSSRNSLSIFLYPVSCFQCDDDGEMRLLLNFGEFLLRFYWYLYVTMVAVLTAVLVATCGIIGFVGLIYSSLSTEDLVGTKLQGGFFLLRPYWVPSLSSGQMYSLVSLFQMLSCLLVFSQPW